MDNPDKTTDESGMWKYLELPRVFEHRASEIDITSKQHLRVCARLAAHVAKQKPKTAKEFEQVEYLKNFVVKSAELNEGTISLLDYMKATIDAIYQDMQAWRDGANLNRIIKDQGEKIEQVIKERDELQTELNDLKKSNRQRDKVSV